ncbi:MAG: hypothetical protein ACO3N7_05130 [Kiritimatiellia bacterium]
MTPQNSLKSNQPFRQTQKPECPPTEEPTRKEVLEGVRNAKNRGLILLYIIRQEDFLAIFPAAHRMVVGSGIFDSNGTWHGGLSTQANNSVNVKMHGLTLLLTLLPDGGFK